MRDSHYEHIRFAGKYSNQPGNGYPASSAGIGAHLPNQSNLIITSLSKSFLAERQGHQYIHIPIQPADKIRHGACRSIANSLVSSIFQVMQRVQNGRIKNRPKPRYLIRGRIRFTFFTQLGAACRDPTLFTERFIYIRDTYLIIRMPMQPYSSTPSTTRRKEKIRSAPGQSIQTIRPRNVTHKCLERLRFL